MSKILVVDDEKEIIAFLDTVLSRAGHTVVAAMDGVQAVQQAMKEKPDLMILDVMMPAGSGITVYTRLKQSFLTQRIPVIFLTAMQTENARGKLPANDTSTILAKPCDPAELIAAVNNALLPS